MKNTFTSQLLLYRFRYFIGYVVIIAIIAGLAVWQITTVPFGLSKNEANTIVHSATLQLSLDTSPVELPFHLLQKASLHFFGLSTLGTKLPSVILGTASGLMLLLLLVRLFRKNVAIITALFTVTASQFLIATRSADSGIMLLFWPILIMLLATLIAQEVKFKGFYGFLLAIAMTLSLYTPLMIYLIIAAAFAALIHPHLRYIAKAHTNLGWLILETMFCLVLLVPLGYSLYKQPGFAYDLLGVLRQVPNLQLYAANLGTAIKQYANFLHPSISIVITPAFNVGAMMLILFGLIRVVIDHFSARSHMLLVWLAFLGVLVSLKPQTLLILFVPSVLLMGIGVQSLIREWYRLFPHNPYARITGLLPLGAFIFVVLGFNYTSYFYGLAYSPAAAHYYSNDLSIARAEALNAPAPLLIVTDDQSIPLMNLLTRERPVQVASVNSIPPTLPATILVAASVQTDLPASIASRLTIVRPVVNSSAEQALRFTLYTAR